MRVLSLPINDNLLELHINLWSSKDYGLWNGKEMSKKFHFIGSQHQFSVPSEDGFGEDIIRVNTSYHWMGYVYDVFLNDKCLLASGKTRMDHQRRRKMPAPERLDLNRPRTTRQQHRTAQPVPPETWSDEDLIV
ncbi:MAG: hypothetical protein AAF840_18110 [Bacteroidota bacterium]